jgi:hypothetical protein
MNIHREPIYATLDNLDDEAFAWIVASIQAAARERGGCKDQEGLANVELACKGYVITLSPGAVR